MNLESTKLICLALFIVMCIPVSILGTINEKRISKKKEILNSKDKYELDKSSIEAIVKASNYTYMLMIVIPTFALMVILYVLMNDLLVSKYVIYSAIAIILIALISFFIIRLITNRHLRNVKKDIYEVKTLKLKKIKEEKNKYYLVFQDEEIKIKKKEKDNYTKGEEYLIIKIKKLNIILPASIYYYTH